MEFAGIVPKKLWVGYFLWLVALSTVDSADGTCTGIQLIACEMLLVKIPFCGIALKSSYILTRDFWDRGFPVWLIEKVGWVA